MLHSNRSEIVPRDFLYATRPPGFQLGQQHDSSEFLSYLLESLNEHEKTTIRQIASNHANGNFRQPNAIVSKSVGVHSKYSQSIESIEKMDIDIDDIDKSIKEEKPPPLFEIHNENPLENTLVNRIFSGKMSTTYKCLNCSYSNENIDTFRDIHLSFPQENIRNVSKYTVQYLLDCYHNVEKLEDDNKYYCDRCKAHCNGERFVNILTAPKILLLTIKYFKYDKKSTSRGKLMEKIILNDTIDLHIENNSSLKYSLYAMVVHSGYSLDGGHYYTFGKDCDNWLKFNDSYVIRTSLDEIENLNVPNTPYILFYKLTSSTLESNESLNKNEESNIDELSPELREYLRTENLRLHNEEFNSHNIAKRQTFI